MVARDVALGCSIEEIAALRNLPSEEVRKVTRGGTFLKAVSEIQKEMDLRVIEEEAEDPIRRKLKVGAMRAANRLVEEIENTDRVEGASSTTRIKAATTVLEMSGYGKQENTSPLAVIMLSPGKLEAVRGTTPIEIVLKDVPDMVDGMPD